MKNTLSKYLKLFICGTLFISGISIGSSKSVNAAETTTLNNNNEELIVSMYDKDGISNITKVNPISKEYSELVSNQSVFLTGNLYEDKSFFSLYECCW